jgi:hypothetical protein
VLSVVSQLLPIEIGGAKLVTLVEGVRSIPKTVTNSVGFVGVNSKLYFAVEVVGAPETLICMARRSPAATVAELDVSLLLVFASDIVAVKAWLTPPLRSAKILLFPTPGAAVTVT